MMEKRAFLLSCSAFAAMLSMGGASRALRALAAGQPAPDHERILRLTRNYAAKFPLPGARQVLDIIRQGKGQHLLISLQDNLEYEAGHVPGSMLFTPEALADPDKLSAFIHKLPQDKSIILICPNGHLSSVVMFFLRQLKLDASAMSLGMYGWNRAYAGGGAYPGDIGGAISNTPAMLDTSRQPEPPVHSGLGDNALVLRNIHGRFMRTVDATSVRDQREGLLLCLRRPEDYAAGHIPGSINIPSEAFLSGDNVITQIPRGQKIVLSCYVGHYSSSAALLLNQLGHDAYSLRWGMAGWNNKYIGPVLQALTNDASLPVESGSGAIYMES